MNESKAEKCEPKKLLFGFEFFELSGWRRTKETSSKSMGWGGEGDILFFLNIVYIIYVEYLTILRYRDSAMKSENILGDFLRESLVLLHFLQTEALTDFVLDYRFRRVCIGEQP